MQTTLVTTRGGKWMRRAGGVPNYCTVGQHMTTGPTWAWYFAESDTTCTACVCEACAMKEENDA